MNHLAREPVLLVLPQRAVHSQHALEIAGRGNAATETLRGFDMKELGKLVG